MRRLSFSEPFVEEGLQNQRGNRCYHTKIPLGYALLILVIMALTTAVICLAVRPNAVPQKEDAKVMAGRSGTQQSAGFFVFMIRCCNQGVAIEAEKPTI